MTTPRPTTGAIEIAQTATEAVGAVANLFVPLGGTAFEILVKKLIQKRINDAEAILLFELRQGNFNILNDEYYEQFVPKGYTFFAAARDGYSKSKLKLLAKCIFGTLSSQSGDDSFDRITRKLDRLNDQEIKIISLIYKLYNSGLFKEDPMRIGKYYIDPETLSLHNKTDALNNSQYLANICYAGFLSPDGAARFDKRWEYYYVNEDLISLCKAAVDLNEQ